MKKRSNILIISVIVSLLFSMHVLSFDGNKLKKYDYSLNQFSIYVPNNWDEIPQDILQEYVKAVSEQFPNLPKQSYEYAFQLKSAKNWLEYPYILIQVKNEGRISSKELKKFDQHIFDKGINSLEENTNSFISDININETIYDPEAHVIWMKMKADIQGVGNVITISAMCLTVNGWIQLSYSAREEDNYKYENVFKEIVNSIEISDVKKYREDKSVFSLNWGKIIGKTIGYGLIGLLVMGFNALFGKRKKSNNTQE